MAANDWNTYFEELAHFLEGAERHYGIANESYTDYVLERLEICVHTCSTLLEHVRGGDLPDLEDEELPLLEDL